jgi:hypothetical protein
VSYDEKMNLASHIYMGNPGLIYPKVVSFHSFEPTCQFALKIKKLNQFSQNKTLKRVMSSFLG